MQSQEPAQTLKATQYAVKDLLRLAQEGRLRLPRFQRGLRWTHDDNRKLLDSLQRGYPVGSLLLWQRPAAQERVQFGRYALDAPAVTDALWIVDGQQRLTALIAGLLGPQAEQRGGDPFALWFHLDRQEFTTVPPSRGAVAVPLPRLRSAVDTSRWALEQGIAPELHELAQRVGEQLRDYILPAYVSTAPDEKVLRSIFDRMNTSGRQLRDAEVFEALNRAFDHEEQSGNPAGSLTARLAEVPFGLGFGEVAGDVLQRALWGVAGHTPRKELPAALRAPGAARVWEAPTAAALDATLRFLIHEARIPHGMTLPYELPLMVLPRFFHLHPQPRERSIELLVRWVARGVATERHPASNQVLNALWKPLRLGGPEEDLVQSLLQHLPPQPVAVPSVGVYNPRGMRTRLLLLALADGEPRSVTPGGGELLDIQEVLTPPEGRGAPALLRLPCSDPELRSGGAAVLLHPAGSGWGELLWEPLSHASEQVLASHGLVGEALDCVRRKDWDGAVRARAEVLRRWVATTLQRRAAWGADDDGPSLEYTLSAGASHTLHDHLRTLPLATQLG